MASIAAKPATARQLREHLQEQQEPFTLSIFLSEREYMMRSLSCNGRSSCCPMTLLTSLKRSTHYHIHKKKIADATRNFKLILYKLISAEVSYCSNSRKDEDEFTPEKTEQTQHVLKANAVDGLISYNPLFECRCEEDCLPFGHKHVLSLAGTCSAFDLGNSEEQEADSDTNPRWGDKKQLNPAPVIQAVAANKVWRHNNKGSSTSNALLGTNFNLVVSSSTWQSMLRSVIGKQNQMISPEPKVISRTGSFMHQKTKWILQRKRKLLFDCMKKARETHRRKRNIQNNFGNFMDLEELGNITDRLISWRKYPTKVMIRVHQMSLDFSDFSSILKEWNYPQHLRRKIGREMADAIMDEIIKELVELFLQ